MQLPCISGRNWQLCLFALFAVVSLAGCGGGVSTFPVEGKVVFSDSSPATELAGYTISFDQEGSQYSASGVIGPDATFRVGTNTDDDGAMPGVHRVIITPPEPKIDERPPPPLIRREYGDFTSSGLRVEVKPEKNQPVLKVDRLKK